jgi:mitotic spindle assembly checkpoint protein MAD2B
MAPTYTDNLTAFLSFLTAYTHTLLYLRSLYPRTSFVQSRFHNTSVWQSRHPLVCEWIRDAVAAVREDLLQGTVARIGIVIFSYAEGKTGAAKIMERYMFDVSTFPVVQKSERDVEIDWESEDDGEADEDEDEDDDEDEDEDKNEARAVRKERVKEKEWDAHVDTDVSEQFRAALIVLTSRTAQLSRLPPNCSFNISMELKDEPDSHPPIRHPQPWIPVQPSLQKIGRKAVVRNEDEEAGAEQGKTKEGQDLGGDIVTPIRAVEAGVFRFDMWVEEGKAKFEGKVEDSTKTSFASSKS